MMHCVDVDVDASAAFLHRRIYAMPLFRSNCDDKNGERWKEFENFEFKRTKDASKPFEFHVVQSFVRFYEQKIMISF